MKVLPALFLALTCAFASPSAGEELNLDLNGRDYDLYQPDGAANTQLPLIVALHGSSGNASAMANHLPLQDFMGEQEFRVAFLNGTKFEKYEGEFLRSWNDESCCGDDLHPDVDDSAFIDAVINDLIARGLAEPGKIFMVGHSNGAKMSYRYVCDHGGVVAAMVAISGARDLKECPGINGMRVLNIHGSDDKSYPLEGGPDDRRPNLIRDPIAAAGESMRQNGADYHLVIVPGAGHRLPSLDRVLSASSGVGLTQAVFNFFFKGEIPKP